MQQLWTVPISELIKNKSVLLEDEDDDEYTYDSEEDSEEDDEDEDEDEDDDDEEELDTDELKLLLQDLARRYRVSSWKNADFFSPTQR